MLIKQKKKNCMESTKSKTAIFSARLDPLHTGHIITIVKLMKRFSKVVVVVLDYKQRETFSAVETKKMLDTIFGTLCPDRLETIINKTHFGTIGINEYLTILNDLCLWWEHTVYCSGNEVVLEHINDIGIPCEFIPRTEGFSGTDERKEDVREKYGSAT